MCAEAKSAAAMAAAGGIEAVVAVLRRHESNAAVAEQACRTLINLSSLGKCQCVQRHTHTHTGWRVRFAALRLVIDVSVCREWRVRAEAKNQAAAAAAAAAAGGIEAVVAVLQRHEGNAAVAEQACRALINIASLGECACVEQSLACWPHFAELRLL